MTFYENLRVLREDRGYTQKQIAEVLGTTQQYYSDYENGKREIPIRIYIALSKFYHVSIDFLAGQNEANPEGSGNSAFYENLRVIREDRGYTQRQIAQVLGTTQQYYSDYENGKREIPIRVYIALSGFYNVSIDYLAGREGEPRQAP